ncbi:uncharacterized protein EDB93DRAFT_1239155 [Suillus bovinus]|uniref:uncharacterized protein n=1 Tax=Suillus bovinus TaxID=48563 RepID=UPI001B86A238|nr:uncharacterized protein EDB93DRAFT_1239155 [Suillus bovinus]KAG2155220.1 hypothetical protein EDB93DRAFT_1239155 [Suillus bovinus]
MYPGHTVETIHDAVSDLRITYPSAGACEMVSLLFYEREMSVARRVVMEYFALYEPELVRQRKVCRLRRRHFWAAGVNDLFAVDQHDKWLKFGLGLHTGIEPFSGRIIYYLNTLEALGHKYFSYMPMVTQSNPGSENYGIANAHMMLRQWHDPSLHSTLQHRWMRSKKNVMPEIACLLEHGVNSGWYDSNNILQVCTTFLCLV